MSKPVFESVFPISGDFNALPVNSIGSAVGYYVHVLGFTLKTRNGNGAVLQRDAVSIGLLESEEDPETVSCYFSVRNIDALWQEYQEKGIEPSEIRTDNHGGSQYRVFFVKEPYGVCFCCGEPVNNAL